jgi:DNA invertase Pin-like site-specific DNA recombinase
MLFLSLTEGAGGTYRALNSGRWLSVLSVAVGLNHRFLATLAVLLFLTLTVRYNMLSDINADRRDALKTIAYLRVSKDTQDLNNQKVEVFEYARHHNLKINQVVEIEISSRKDRDKRRVDEVLSVLRPGDNLIVSELSRLGRSTGEVISIIDELIRKKVKFVAIKQNWIVNGENDMLTKVMKTVLSLFAELERDLISQRTKQALAARKAAGQPLGRPKGSTGVSKLDGKRKEIEELLKDRAAKAFIARRLKVSRTTLIDYIKTRGLE